MSEFNYKGVAFWMALGVFMLLLLGILISGASASDVNATNISVVTVEEDSGYGKPFNFTPYIYQGDEVPINATVDISGVAPPYKYLAYWDGYDMYEDNASYQIELPQRKSGYYNFYIDPAIFSTRPGKWFKYDGIYEPRGNNLAFIVVEPKFYNYTTRYQNGTLVNTSIPITQDFPERTPKRISPLPDRHIADYLVARGDALNISAVNETIRVWMFGRSNHLLNYASVNGSVYVPEKLIYGFEPDDYTILVQRTRANSTDFTVTYDELSKSIKYFDPVDFKITCESISSYAPSVVRDRLQKIIPSTFDNWSQYKLVLQEPSMEIMSITERDFHNDTVNYAGETIYYSNISYLEVVGYTNTAEGTPLKFIIDEDQQSPRTLKYHTTMGVAEGSDKGSMRWFEVYVPINKYEMALGDHVLSAYTNISSAPTKYTFTNYGAPPNSYVPPKTIRYIAGRNGPEEYVPLPTPVVQTVTVVETVRVVEQVTVEVTPAQEQVRDAQYEIAKEFLMLGLGIAGVVILGLGIFQFVYRAWMRRRWMKE